VHPAKLTENVTIRIDRIRAFFAGQGSCADRVLSAKCKARL
jgi:hypothetical protein